MRAAVVASSASPGTHGTYVKRTIVLAALGILTAISTSAYAQDLEPRAYSNAPVGLNFVLAGYAYSEGELLFDPSVPIEGAQATINSAVAGYARVLSIAGHTSKIAVAVPYVDLDGSGLVNGQVHRRQVTGFADPSFIFSFNFSGAPALPVSEFRKYRQETIAGAAIRVTAPLGQYDSDRLLNIGTNRWSFRPEIGVSHARGKWVLEGSVSAALFTTNDDFFGGQRLEIDPIYATQAHVVYDIKPGLWVAFDATYYIGGRSTVDGVRKDNELDNWRLGLTLSVPINRYHSIKFAGSTGIFTRTGSDFDALAAVWQYRWGGGY